MTPLMYLPIWFSLVLSCAHCRVPEWHEKNKLGIIQKTIFFLDFSDSPRTICFCFYDLFTDYWSQVIADFDATLTKFWVNGTRGQSMSPQHFISPFFAPFDAKTKKNCF